MPVTLDQLVDRDDLGLRPLTGAVEGVPVSWAHAIELEDPTAWLSGDELILTTGLRLPRSRIEQAAYAQRLHDAGVAGLAFGVGVRFREVPAALVDECRRLGLPLLEVPLATPFLAITQTVAQALSDEQHAVLQSAVDFQHDLTVNALAHGLEGAAQTLARALEGAVLILDELGRALARADAPAGMLARVRSELGRHREGRRTSISVPTPGGILHIQSADTATHHRGWLAVQSATAPSGAQRLLVNQALAVMTLLLERPAELFAARRELGATVLGLMLAGPPESAQARRHLPHFGFRPDDDLVLAVVEHPDGTADQARGVAEALATQLDDSGHPHLIGIDFPGLPGGDTVRGPAGAAYGQPAQPPMLAVVVRASSARPDLAHLRGILDRFAHEAVIGVSAPVRPSDLHRAVVTARQAAAAAARRHRGTGWFDRLTLEAVLDEPGLRGRIAALAEPSLGPLLAAGDPELLRSLRAFLEHNGTWDPAARSLGVHRHTLRARMAKVEALTGLSLDVAQNRVVLLIALMTLDDG
ncbi:MAG: PucR family transcriptional regulator [Micrococcales bacterium]|nr:PucR family transcriptional regulator [Micrococcales bacterium]